MIGSSGQNPNPAVPSSSSYAPGGGGGGGGGGGDDALLRLMASYDPRLLFDQEARRVCMETFFPRGGDSSLLPMASNGLQPSGPRPAGSGGSRTSSWMKRHTPLHACPWDCYSSRTAEIERVNAHPIASDGPDPPPPSDPTAALEPNGGGDSEESEIVEIDAAELLADHIHFCEICGKGFKRDAKLWMHMRAHGDPFKTLEALAGPSGWKPVRFSCPFPGCNRNRAHRCFRPVNSAVSVKDHFKRIHYPKMYACNRCNKKSFSVLADLKSHLKHCGETPWQCSCGTSFSRKDKLFGHLALFEGHFPAIAAEEATGKQKEPEINREAAGPSGGDGFDPDFFEGLMDEFEGIGEGNWPDR